MKNKNNLTTIIDIVKNEDCEINRQDLLKSLRGLKSQLDILNVLKKSYDKDSYVMSCEKILSFFITDTNKDFDKIKEWLDEE